MRLSVVLLGVLLACDAGSRDAPAKETAPKAAKDADGPSASDGSATEPTTAVTTPEPAPPAAPKDVDHTLTLPNEKGTVVVHFSLPAGWIPSEGYGAGTWEPPEQPDEGHYTTLRVTAECNGSCAADAIPKNMKEALDGLMNVTPNINSGDPALDAVRGNAEVLHEAKTEAGAQLKVVKITYPEDAPGGPYRPGVRMECLVQPSGAEFFVQLSGGGPEAAAQFQGGYVAACDSLVVDPPALK